MAPLLTSARRTIALSFTASGRATRSEVLAYGVFVLAISFPILVICGFVLPYEQRRLVDLGLTVLATLPAVALLIRRLHDQARGASWALPAIAAFLCWAARTAAGYAMGPSARSQFDQLIWPLDWLLTVANLLTIALLLLPGTKGSNAFGPDPRQLPAD